MNTSRKIGKMNIIQKTLSIAVVSALGLTLAACHEHSSHTHGIPTPLEHAFLSLSHPDSMMANDTNIEVNTGVTFSQFVGESSQKSIDIRDIKFSAPDLTSDILTQDSKLSCTNTQAGHDCDLHVDFQHLSKLQSGQYAYTISAQNAKPVHGELMISQGKVTVDPKGYPAYQALTLSSVEDGKNIFQFAVPNGLKVVSQPQGYLQQRLTHACPVNSHDGLDKVDLAAGKTCNLWLTPASSAIANNSQVIGVFDTDSLLTDKLYQFKLQYGASLYVGGTLKNGNTYYIARYDGSTWNKSAKISGSGNSLKVNALATNRLGDIYAGGKLSYHINYNARHKLSVHKYVLEHKNNSWLSVKLSGNVDSTVNDLAVNHDDELYIATTRPDRIVTDINGVTNRWKKFNHRINTMLPIDGDNLLAAGNFTDQQHYQYVTLYMKKFNSWRNLNNLNKVTPIKTLQEFNGSVNTLTMGNTGTLYAAGKFSFYSPQFAQSYYISEFRHRQWQRLNHPSSLVSVDIFDNTINKLLVMPNGKLDVLGNFTMANTQNRYVAQYTRHPGKGQTHWVNLNANLAATSAGVLNGTVNTGVIDPSTSILYIAGNFTHNGHEYVAAYHANVAKGQPHWQSLNQDVQQDATADFHGDIKAMAIAKNINIIPTGPIIQ